MKRYQALAVALTACLALCACQANPATPSETAAPTEQVAVENVTVDAETAEPEATPEQTPETAPQATPAGTLSERVSAMMPIMDSIVRTIGIEGETAYAPEDATLVWQVLYLAGENWSGEITGAARDGDTVVVPHAVMEELALAAFSDIAALPEIPEALLASVTYDEASDSYRLAPSDKGDTETALSTFYETEDGGIIAYVALNMGDGKRLGEIRFALSTSQAASAQFPMRVTGAAHSPISGDAYVPVAADEKAACDLDGNGTEETVSFAVTGDDQVTLKVEYDGKTYTDMHEYLYNATLHIADTLADDGAREIYLCGDTGSDDYVTYIYRLNNGEITKVYLDGSVETVDGSGAVRLTCQVDIMGTWGGVCTYRMGTDGAFTLASDYTLLRIDEAWQYNAVTTQKDGLVATQADGTETTLPAGTKLLGLRTDLQTYVLCEREDGTRVTVAYEKNTAEWGWLVQGEPESAWFGEVPYAG